MFTDDTLTSLERMLDVTAARAERRVNERELQIKQEMSQRGLLASSLVLQRLAKYYEAMTEKFAEEAFSHLISANEAEPPINLAERVAMLTDLLRKPVRFLHASFVGRFDHALERAELSNRSLTNEIRSQLVGALIHTDDLWSGKLRMRVLASANTMNRRGDVAASVTVIGSQIGNIQFGHDANALSNQRGTGDDDKG